MLKVSTNMWFWKKQTKSVKEDRASYNGAFTLDVKSVLK
jgi:hypothetical protein